MVTNEVPYSAETLRRKMIRNTASMEAYAEQIRTSADSIIKLINEFREGNNVSDTEQPPK